MIAIIDEKLEEGPYKNAVRNKVDQLNQMSVRDKNESFFAQLGITYGEREIQAIRMRNVLHMEIRTENGCREYDRSYQGSTIVVCEECTQASGI